VALLDRVGRDLELEVGQVRLVGRVRDDVGLHAFGPAGDSEEGDARVGAVGRLAHAAVEPRAGLVGADGVGERAGVGARVGAERAEDPVLQSLLELRDDVEVDDRDRRGDNRHEQQGQPVADREHPQRRGGLLYSSRNR
jgi:hypothetical protein